MRANSLKSGSLLWGDAVSDIGRDVGVTGSVRMAGSRAIAVREELVVEELVVEEFIVRGLFASVAGFKLREDRTDKLAGEIKPIARGAWASILVIASAKVA